MTILENNCVQSIATAAGYMTMPLTSGIAAYMWATNGVLPWWQIMVFMTVLSILGVLVAFPMKRRFINDEQHPFPEGRACGVVLDTLYDKTAAAAGMLKARVLARRRGRGRQRQFPVGRELHEARAGEMAGPAVCLAPADELSTAGITGSWSAATHRCRRSSVWMSASSALTPAVDFAMIGAGGLMGIRAAGSLLLGAVLNFVIVVPIMISAR